MTRGKPKRKTRRKTATPAQRQAGLRIALRRILAGSEPASGVVDDAQAAAVAERVDRQRAVDAVGARIIADALRAGLHEIADAIRNKETKP
jgi:hypothetical protein